MSPDPKTEPLDTLPALFARVAALAHPEAVGAMCDDQLERWQRGERVPVEVYLAACPAVALDPACAFELVYHEYALRSALGERPTAEEYRARFPALADRLQVQLALRDAIRNDDAPGVPPVGHPLPTVPGYEITRELGRGGVGVVYEARQRGLNRLVALKTIPGGTGHETIAFQRLEAEAAALARLRHQNVVQVFDVIRADGGPFIALELMTDGTLADRLRTGPLPPRTAAELVGTLARAMHEVHRQEIVHRDLKPSNVLFTHSQVPADPPVPKISDFGLAKFLDTTLGGLTRTGDVVGTPAYMAPEQVSGGAVGPEADVYALGAVLYECLTGRPPFRGAGALETLWQVKYDVPPAPARLRPGVPRDLSTVCLKCLEKSPSRRYRTAADLAEDLDRFLADRTVSARPVGALGRVARAARRAPVVALLIATVAASLVGGLVAVHWQWQRAADNLERAEDGLYQTRVASAALLRDSDTARADAVLDLCAPGAGAEDRRGWEWHYLKRQCRTARHVSVERDWVYALAVAPDGNELAVACGAMNRDNRAPNGGAGEVVLRAPHTGQPVGAALPGPGSAESVAYSPDGRLIATAARDGTVRVRARTGTSGFERKFVINHIWVTFRPDSKTVAVGLPDRFLVLDATTGAELAELPVGSTAGPVYTPDGQWLVCAGQRRLVLWAPGDGRQRELTGAPAEVCSVAVSPDGARVAAVGEGSTRGAVWRLSDDHLQCRLTGLDGPVYAVAFSPRSQILATAGSDHTVRLWDAETGEPTKVLRAHTHTVRALAFSPDGEQLYSGGQDQQVLAWAVSGDPRGRFLFSAQSAWIDGLSFDPDGRTIRAAYLGSRASLRSWDIDGTVLAVRSPALHEVLRYPGRQSVFCAGGQKLVAIHHDHPNELGVWDVNSGELVTRWAGQALPVGIVAASPDGTRVAAAAWTKEPAAGEFTIRDVSTGTTVASLPGGPVGSLALGPTNRYLAVGGLGGAAGGTVTVWDLTTRRARAAFSGHGESRVTGLAFSPDGQRLASVGFDQRLRVHEVGTGRLVFDAVSPLSPTCVTYSPDGRRIAVVGYDGAVVLWDVRSGLELLSLPSLRGRRHEDRATNARVQFSPNGHWLVSTNWDMSISVWDGRPLGADE